MDADPASSVRTHEGLLARARRRGRCATARPRPWSAPATPAPPWPARCCAWAASRACPARRSPRPIPVPGRHAHRAARRRRQRRVPARVAGAVRPDGRGVRPRPLRHRPPRRWRCCRSARSPPRATRWSRRPTSCSPTAAGSAPPGRTFVGNVEGRDLMTDEADVVVTDGFTGNVALKTLEGGLQAPGRRRCSARSTRPTRPGRPAEALCRRSARSTRRSTPRTPAARCSSASTGSASSATARRRPPRSSTRSGSPGDMVDGDVVDHLRAAVRRRLTAAPSASDGTFGRSRATGNGSR